MKKTKLNKKGKSETAKKIQLLTKLSHDFVRNRDSVHGNGTFAGYCFDCNNWCEGQQFQAGHWIADSVGGMLLRYHPHNMHGQSGGCNMKYSQERVKINYTFKMIDKYGKEYVDHLRSLQHKKDAIGMPLRADSIFYDKMIELYTKGEESKIVAYLDSF